MDMMSYLMGRNSSSAKKGAKIEVVTELPETGEANVIYLVPKQDTSDNDVFDEYIWINDDWELIGSTDIDISGKQDVMQFSTMPTVDSTTVGKIIQYTGTTGNGYTNGYFYIGTTDGTNYSWSNINVQPVPNMSNYLAKNNTTSFTPSGDYNPATKKYVDDAVAGAGGGNTFPTYTIDLDTILYANGIQLSSTDKTKLSTAFTDAYSKGYKMIQLLINYRTNQSNTRFVYQNLMFPNYGMSGNSVGALDISTKPTAWGFQSVGHMLSDINYPGDRKEIGISFYSLTLSLSWSGDTCSVTSAIYWSSAFGFPTLTGVLSKTNNISYTPINNYNPSTKLYTDLATIKASGLLPYSTSTSYQIGDYIYRGATDPTIYKCKVANTTGSWNSANWDQKTYMEYLSDTLVGGALNGSY